MKLRTKENLIDFLADEMAWRKKELSTVKNRVEKSSKKIQPTEIRSGILLLYAHWEGFLKRAAEAYLNFVIYQRLTLKELRLNFVALCTRKELNEFKLTNKATIHNQILEYLNNCDDERFNVTPSNVVRTGSNLNSEILKEITAGIGLDFSKYETKANLIDEQLLNYRNNIAHGQFLEIDSSDYLRLHEEIRVMIENYKTDIENSVLLENYKK